MDSRKDILILGATGFTGKRVAQYAIKRYCDLKKETNIVPFTLGFSGREQKRLKEAIAPTIEKYRESIDVESLEYIVVDIADESSVDQACSKYKVVINCIGPFQLYGEVVVKNCIKHSTDYVDITGEPYFIDNMMHRKGEEAVKQKCTLVPACGFDSVPADMGVLYTILQMQKMGATCTSVESYLSIKGSKGVSINFATLDSLMLGLQNVPKLIKLRKEIESKREKINYLAAPLRRPTYPEYRKETNSYCVEFKGSDASVVRNSQFYFNSHEDCPKPVRYSAMMTIPSFYYVVLYVMFGSVLQFLVGFRFGRYLISKYPGFFTFGLFTHRGPSQQQVDNTSFSMVFHAKGFNNESVNPKKEANISIVTKLSGPEPGYVVTPVCVTEAAITLLKEKEKIPYGVLSPAAAFHKTGYLKSLSQVLQMSQIK